MSNKLIWSTTMTQDYISSLPREAKINALADWGYDREMLDTASDEKLDRAISEDESMWQNDVDDFEYGLVPAIASQTYDGIVLMCGDSSTWDGTRKAGKAVLAEDLAGGDIDRDVYDVEIVTDGDGLTWFGKHHDGTHVMNLYAIPEVASDLMEFVEDCMAAKIEDLTSWEDLSREEAIEEICTNLTKEELNDWCDFSKVPESCKRISYKPSVMNFDHVEESLTEEKINEVKAKDPEALLKELEEIKGLSDEYGYEYFTAMPFTAYDGDPESVEYNYPNFFKVVKAFFKEMGIISKEDLDNGDVLDQEWYSDIDQHDWDTLMRACEFITKKHGDKYTSAQFEKIYKDNFDDGLGEDLTEAALGADSRHMISYLADLTQEADMVMEDILVELYERGASEAISGLYDYISDMFDLPEIELSGKLTTKKRRAISELAELLDESGEYDYIEDLLVDLYERGADKAIWDLYREYDAMMNENYLLAGRTKDGELKDGTVYKHKENAEEDMKYADDSLEWSIEEVDPLGSYADEEPVDEAYEPSRWDDEDIELHKSIDWRGRDYKEFPVEGSEIEGEATVYRKNAEPEKKTVKFKKFLRPNPIYPPYYKSEEEPFENVVGAMYDGDKHGKYGIHNRYEDEDVYNMLSEATKDVEEFGPDEGPWGKF